MNSSSALPFDAFYKSYITTPIVYYGTLYGLTPFSCISILMNLITYIILRKKKFQSSKIFTYLRYNAFNSLIISLLLLTRFTVISYNFFDFTNTYGALVYACYFFLPFLSIFYLNGNLLDIYITIERVHHLVPNNSLKRIVNTKHFWLIIFMVSLIINIPNFFVSQPFYLYFKLNDNTIIRKYLAKPTVFSASNLGKLITYMIYFIRDILTLVIKIILNIYAVVLIRKYFYKVKSNLKRINRVSAQTENVNDLNTKSYYTKVDRNLTFISISMCILSSFENIFYIASYILAAFKYDDTLLNLYFFSNIIIAFKHSSNLIILYSFNSVFKQEFKKILWCCIKFKK